MFSNIFCEKRGFKCIYYNIRGDKSVIHASFKKGDSNLLLLYFINTLFF